jgi:EAL domain-containing protein (putative c-di-GMP-specific phosphodiesterase class I)
MGRNLGLEVVAEGVETTAQADFLRSEGCHELQGFLFSKPLPKEAFEKFLLSSPTETPETIIQTSRLVG